MTMARLDGLDESRVHKLGAGCYLAAVGVVDSKVKALRLRELSAEARRRARQHCHQLGHRRHRPCMHNAHSVDARRVQETVALAAADEASTLGVIDVEREEPVGQGVVGDGVDGRKPLSVQDTRGAKHTPQRCMPLGCPSVKLSVLRLAGRCDPVRALLEAQLECLWVKRDAEVGAIHLLLNCQLRRPQHLRGISRAHHQVVTRRSPQVDHMRRARELAQASAACCCGAILGCRAVGGLSGRLGGRCPVGLAGVGIVAVH
mmetsp:Transcript_14182/g.41242  ORF Transcript_14182/g.41242 Transcript_14182/m.41242 type:complete len:260 (-) Transcript_14182:174-953(-)